MAWRPGKCQGLANKCLKDRDTHKTPDWVGTTFRETIEEKGDSTEMQGIVTGYVENRSLAMHLSGKYNVVDVEWQISEIGKITRLTLDSNIQFKSFVKIFSIILWPVFRNNVQKQLSLEYAKLKELCEQGR
jgi:hypothetical protein